MTGTKYLSDVIDADSFCIGKFNIITAPCGCGKTTAAINVIAQKASAPNRVLFLIDTINGREQLAKNPVLTKPYVFFPDIIGSTWGEGAEYNDKIVVTTYSQFGVWSSQYENFTDNFELIICDEAHNIVIFPTFSIGDVTNYAAIARKSIEQAVLREKTLFVGITATPEPLSKLSCPQCYILIDTAQLHHYTENKIVHFLSMNQVLESIPSNETGMLYCSRITEMKKMEQLALEYDRKPICIWSVSNEKHPMTEEQHAARRYIIENEALPPQYDFLIINASCETSINIRSQIDFFIAHDGSELNITQARGRYRGDLETLFIRDKMNGEIDLPVDYLNTELFSEGKEALRDWLDIKDEKGHPISWKKLIPILEKCGYSIDCGRRDNRRYIIITEK